MAKFRYATSTGELKTFDAENAQSALSALSGFKDAAPTSGVMEVRNPGISASSMPMNDVNRFQAQDDARKNLYPETTDKTNNQIGTNYLSGSMEDVFRQDLINSNKEYRQSIEAQAREGQRILDKNFDISLAKEDFEYQTLMEQLNRDRQKAIEVATSNAIALNPYSQSRGAQTAANFNNAINSEYDRQTAKITRQFQLAREALAAGHAEAAYKLRKSAQDSLADANQQFKQGLMSLYQQAQEQQRFDIQQQSKYQDDFIDAIANLDLTDPEGVDLSGIVEKGKKAGLGEGEIESFINRAAKLQGIELKDKDLDRRYKEAMITSMSRKDTGGDTVAERKASATAKFAEVFVPGSRLPDGTEIIGFDGYINPNAWKQAIADAPLYGLTRKDFITEFGYLLNPINTDYGLTPTEKKLISGELE